MKFDLVTEKTDVDVKTLNYVWDWLWRMNAISERKNIEQRTRCAERENIMKLLENIADWL